VAKKDFLFESFSKSLVLVVICPATGTVNALRRQQPAASGRRDESKVEHSKHLKVRWLDAPGGRS
jgi:hypothetical protein